MNAAWSSVARSATSYSRPLFVSKTEKTAAAPEMAINLFIRGAKQILVLSSLSNICSSHSNKAILVWS